MTALSLGQRLLLVKYLTETLTALRKAELLPQSAGEMPSGARLPVMFGGKLAGWASMPQPSKKTPYVSDAKALLAWAGKQYPEKVGTEDTVRVTPALIKHLEEHFPAAVIRTRQVDPQWVSDITDALKSPGYYVTVNGDKLTTVPGITVPESDPPSPRVTLEENAAAVIGAAWQAGDIPFGDLLALPAAGNGSQP